MADRFPLLTYEDSESGKTLAYALFVPENYDAAQQYDAFHLFDNQSIEESLSSSNPLVRVFVLLDRHLEKRRLLAIGSKMEQKLPWVRAFYVIRMQAEGLTETETPSGKRDV